LLFGHAADPDENGRERIEEENIRVNQIFLGEVGHFLDPHEAGCIRHVEESWFEAGNDVSCLLL